ncbi:MAG: glucosaminidase domain-containing protein [Maledivibacter sp.]|jgi:flagellum-specific peptidoglycan hydrolase FlgJ|nr:glucosaminidase domain-containing protein [Maledivibacter sp.]
MSNYFDRMKPHAQRASKALGIPVSVILAQWAHESDYGRSWGARHRNNHAGISNFSGKPYSWSKAYKVEPRPKAEGAYYNVYRDVEGFVDDYIHVMNLGYYKAVREAGKTPGIDDDVRELGKSPFAGTHYKKNGVFGGSIMDMIKTNGLTKYDGLHNASLELDKVGEFKETMKKNPNDVILNKDSKIAMFTGVVALGLIALFDD